MFLIFLLYIDGVGQQFDITYKAIVIGESQVGKTALVKRYKNPTTSLQNLMPTIGNNFFKI